MQVYEKKLHLSTLLERAGEELGLIEDVLVAEYGPEVPVPELTLPVAEAPRRPSPSEPTERPTRPFVRAEQRARLAMPSANSPNSGG